MIFGVEVSTRGLSFDEVASKFGSRLKQALIERLTDIAWARAVSGAPRRTGYLASRIVKNIGEGRASIEALADCAIYVEKGTRPHLIFPVRASCLAFEVAGEMVFTRLVRHPGTRPNPFMQRAVDETRGRVEEVFAELWWELIGWWGNRRRVKPKVSAGPYGQRMERSFWLRFA